jgi:hypothetical protein
LPRELFRRLATRPVRGSRVRAISPLGKTWMNGSSLQVRFIGRTAAQRALVRGQAQGRHLIDTRGASMARLVPGQAPVAGAVAAAWLLARGQPHAANALQLTLAFMGEGVTALAVGVGISGVAVPGVRVLIVSGGLLNHQRAVSWLTPLYIVIIGAPGWAESGGWIAGSAALHGLGLGLGLGDERAGAHDPALAFVR